MVRSVAQARTRKGRPDQELSPCRDHQQTANCWQSNNPSTVRTHRGLGSKWRAKWKPGGCPRRPRIDGSHLHSIWNRLAYALMSRRLRILISMLRTSRRRVKNDGAAVGASVSRSSGHFSSKVANDSETSVTSVLNNPCQLHMVQRAASTLVKLSQTGHTFSDRTNVWICPSVLICFTLFSSSMSIT